jgi:type III secretion system FlhB-like substrate exporter
MTYKETAYQILKNSNKPLTAKEICALAKKEGLISSEGKTPEATISAQIYMDIKKKGDESLFTKEKRGVFGLAEWNTAIESNKVVQRLSLTDIENIVDNLEERELKSNAPTEFEETIKDAFSFLGFGAELIGGSGDTDVLLTANIGQESYKVSVDGKTSKNGKIIDSQINWLSLKDHREKNKADYIVVVGHDFAGGNLDRRAKEYNVSLLKTSDLIKLIKAHSKFPFTLSELKDLFSGLGERSTQLDDLLTQNISRRNLLEQFRTIIEEMESLQDRLGYFTFDSLAGREKIEELEINPEDIEYVINLFKLPFINGIKEISENKYILTIKINDVANIFKQISYLLIDIEKYMEPIVISNPSVPEKSNIERKTGTKYFKWYIKGHSVVALARKDNHYEHYCPIEHFRTIIDNIINAFKNQNVVNNDLIFSMLNEKDLSSDRPFKGKAEEYKIRMALGILEIENLIKWTGSKRPIEYTLIKTHDEFKNWYDNINATV